MDISINYLRYTVIGIYLKAHTLIKAIHILYI